MNEEENVRPLLEEIVAALQHESFEVLFVDDCSKDSTVSVLENAKAEFPMLRCLYHGQNCGQSSAVRTGVHRAQGTLVVVLDGDGQNDPADIPVLLNAFRHPEAPNNLGMVAGERRKRHDNWRKRMASRVGNGIRRSILRDNAKDAGCGLKVLSRTVFMELPYFDHMHRFMSALILRHGYEIIYVSVNHRPRVHGQSKYGVIDRMRKSITDLWGVRWLRRRCRLPIDVTEI